MKRVTIPQQHLKLMDFKTPAGGVVFFGPPVEPALGQTFLTKPESLAVIAQNFDGSPSPVNKYEQISGKRIRLQHLPAYPGQAVDALSEVHGFCCQKYPHMGRDLNHGAPARKYLPRSSTAGSARPLRHMRIFMPVWFSISMTQSE